MVLVCVSARCEFEALWPGVGQASSNYWIDSPTGQSQVVLEARRTRDLWPLSHSNERREEEEGDWFSLISKPLPDTVTLALPLRQELVMKRPRVI